VIRVLDAPPDARGDARLPDRAGDYTLTPMPAMLRLATRAPGLGDPPSMRKVYRLGDGRARPDDRGARPGAGDAGAYGGLAFTLGELAEMAA
jgi:primosomal protein N' (replication factor Y)